MLNVVSPEGNVGRNLKLVSFGSFDDLKCLRANAVSS